ncbi:MAG TPA: hypothetical protein VM915_15585 [Verrucomicrobiae bacterium]|nr:hypothetical protein [Verrucomicrobiae bacterium]
MPNVLNPEPARAFAARAAAKISTPHIAARFERLVFGEVLTDPTCLRPAHDDEIDRGPDWARAAKARGEQLHVFNLSRSASVRLHGIARRVEQTCKLAHSAIDDTNATIVTLACAFLLAFDRADFRTIARKTQYYARIYNNTDHDENDKIYGDAQSVICASGLVWRRLISIAQMRDAGRTFNNCLARTTQGSTYGRRLRRGTAQYWMLTDHDGAPLIVAMAPAPLAEWFNEVRGPRNARVPHDDPDLLRLARAIGIIRSDPPPSAAAALIPLGPHTPSHVTRRAA